MYGPAYRYQKYPTDSALGTAWEDEKPQLENVDHAVALQTDTAKDASFAERLKAVNVLSVSN